MNKKVIIALIAVPLLLASCGKKKQHDDIIVQNTEAPKPQAPIRMQDYRQTTDVQWLGKQYQIEVVRTASDSLAMVKDEVGQEFVDNRITLKVIRQDGSIFCTKTFTKSAFTGCLDDDYRKTGILEGFVFDRAEGNQTCSDSDSTSPPARGFRINRYRYFFSVLRATFSACAARLRF